MTGSPPPASRSDAGPWFLDLAGRRRRLAEGEVVIGRQPSPRGAAIALPVSDGTVSRNHARLHLADGRLTLIDLSSSNGTFVNEEAVTGEVELAPGDRVRLGRVRLVVGRSEPDEADDTGTGVIGRAPRGRRFCPSCGALVAGERASCPNCGEDLLQERPLSRSEAIAMSEVLPVGEALAQPPRRREVSSVMTWERSAAQVASGAPRHLDDTTGVDLEAVLRAEEEGLAAVEAEAERGAAEARPLFLPAASFSRRLGAALVDTLLVATFGAVVWMALALLGGPAGSSMRSLGGAVAAAVLAWAVVAVVGVWRWGTTPGKRGLRLWVCDLDGRPGLAVGHAAARFLAYGVSLLTLGYGFLRCGMAADGRALHDLLARTYVAHPSRDVLLAEGRGRRRRFRRRQRAAGPG